MPLTDIAIRNAKPGTTPDGRQTDKPYKMGDSGGLYLEVQPSGAKWWRFKYYFLGKEKRLSLGVYPGVTLKQAREKRDDARKRLADGKDPSAERQEEKRAASMLAGNSFASVAREWLDNVREKWTPDHHAYTLKRFEAYAFPEIGHLPIAETDAPALLAMARKIEARGTIETARKVVRACGQVFRYGIATGRCRGNPAADLRDALKPKPAVRHMAALSAADLPELLAKIEAYDAEAGGDLQTKLALRLLALTFVRTGELREAEWSEIDLEAAEWRIPADRMKMGQPHLVPLSRQALEVLRELWELNGRYTHVFPGRNPRIPMSKNTVLFALYRMGYRGRMTGHGFRAVASTILNEMNFDPDVIERQLAHVEKNKVRAAYHRTEYREERRRMMQAWADHLDALRDGAGVVPNAAGSRK
jgi:integrase